MRTVSNKIETLAIDGGTPLREKLLPYGRQSLDEKDIQAVVEVLRSDWLTTGPASAMVVVTCPEITASTESLAPL